MSRYNHLFIRSLFTLSSIYRTNTSRTDQMPETNQNLTGLRIPTGRRQTSRSVAEELNSGLL